MHTCMYCMFVCMQACMPRWLFGGSSIVWLVVSLCSSLCVFLVEQLSV